MASSVAGRRKRRKKNPRIRRGKLGSLRTMKERSTRFFMSVWRGRRGLPHPACPTRRGHCGAGLEGRGEWRTSTGLGVFMIGVGGHNNHHDQGQGYGGESEK